MFWLALSDGAIRVRNHRASLFVPLALEALNMLLALSRLRLTHWREKFGKSSTGRDSANRLIYLVILEPW
jgi:hypothetical protein